MEIYIPTLGRAHRQVTLDNLPAHWQSKVHLVVQKKDYQLNKEKYDSLSHRVKDVILLPEEIATISPTRKFIMHTANDSAVLMLDDDLVFSRRRTDEPTKFEPMSTQDYDDMFNELAEVLTYRAHAGVSHREGANRNTNQYVENTRQMRVTGYNRDVVTALGVQFGRIEVMEDFDVCLQLLRRGEASLILNNYVHNQGGSDVEGGCSTFRTKDLQDQCARELARLHPDFVKVVYKETKSSWGGGTRADVRIQWKKAYEYGRRQA